MKGQHEMMLLSGLRVELEDEDDLGANNLVGHIQ
jgi:hypothetical protein